MSLMSWVQTQQMIKNANLKITLVAFTVSKNNYICFI